MEDLTPYDSGDASRSKEKKLQMKKSLLASALLKLLVVRLSRQVALDFTASQLTPLNTAASSGGASFLVTTNLISWDNGVTYSPIYGNQKISGYLSLWDQKNNLLMNVSVNGAFGHLLDPEAKKVFIDKASGGNGPILYDLTGTTSLSLTKIVEYPEFGYGNFKCLPVQSLDHNTYYFFSYYSTLGPGVQYIAMIDSSTTSQSFLKIYSWNADSGESKFIFLPTTKAKCCNLFISFVSISLISNRLDARFFSKPNLDLFKPTTTTMTTPGGLIVAPTTNFATLDNLDETKLYFLDHYSNNIILFPGMFDSSTDTLTQSMVSTSPIAPLTNNQFLAAINIIWALLQCLLEYQRT